MNDDAIRVINQIMRKKVLEDFWFVAKQIDSFVGHNIMDFDLRFLLQRFIVLGVKPSWNRFQELGKKPWEMGKYLHLHVTVIYQFLILMQKLVKFVKPASRIGACSSCFRYSNTKRGN